MKREDFSDDFWVKFHYKYLILILEHYCIVMNFDENYEPKVKFKINVLFFIKIWNLEYYYEEIADRMFSINEFQQKYLPEYIASKFKIPE